MEENTMKEEQHTEQNTDNNSAPETAAKKNDSHEEQLAKLQREVDELKDKYLRQLADFDNLRKRVAKERLEIMQTAGREIVEALLPVLDDSERAEKQFESAQDIAALKEGLYLVFGKFRTILKSKGLKPMESIGQEFNPEFHEAISEIPAPSEDMKGKVIDEVEKGYYLNDKIIRFAKVVVGK